MRPIRLFVAAAALAGTAPALADDVADIRAAVEAFLAAQQAGDTTALGRLLAPDFLFVRGTGEIGDRRDFLAGFAGAGRTLRIEASGDPLLVRPTPDSAIVGGEARAVVTEGGRGFRQRYRFSDVLARREGRWQIVYLQISALP